MPEFEDEEGPDAMAVVPDFGFVFGDEAADFGGVEIAAVESAVVQQEVVDHVAEFVAEPVIEGDAETHLGAVLNLRGEELGEGFDQDFLADVAGEFPVDRHTGGEFYDVMIEEGVSAFEAVGHAGDIDFGEDIAGEVGEDVDAGGAGDEVAVGAFPIGVEEEVGGVGVMKFGGEVWVVEFAAAFGVQDADPFEVAAFG